MPKGGVTDRPSRERWPKARTRRRGRSIMNLTDDTQQNIQMRLDFSPALTGEARKAGREETESSGATNGPESPASTDRLMEAVIERENPKEALRRVKANKGSAGVDGMTIGDLTDYLKQHWPAIRERLLNGTYEPKPVRRAELAKPDGGVRKLGIPTVLDRFLQQAVLQVRQRKWDSDVLPTQLRFPARTICASGGSSGTAVHGRRLPLGGRFRFGEMFRSSQSR